MKNRKVLLYLANIILLSAGAIVAASLSAANIQQEALFAASVGYVSLITLALLLLLVAVEAISALKISDSTVHTVLIALFLFLFYFVSPDVLSYFDNYSLTPPTELCGFLSFLFLQSALGAVIYFLNFNYKTGITGKYGILFIVLGVLFYAVFSLLYYSHLQYVAYALYLIEVFVYAAYIHLRTLKDHKEDYVYAVCMLILHAIAGMGLTDILSKSGIWNCSTLGYSLIYMMIISVLFISIYVAYIIQTERKARIAGEYKLLYERTKINALRGQIKPHFVFNLLSTIKALYRINLDEGDRAVNLFSRHLRANVEAAEKDLIPFDKELDYINIYTELENLKLDNKFRIIYDIDYTDFEVPILGLQPYIENSIKYSKVNETEDGYIKITSRADDEEILLEISDNGVGFDVSSVGENSYGIKNSFTRFKLLLGCEPQIISAPGDGTKIIIKIAKRGG